MAVVDTGTRRGCGAIDIAGSRAFRVLAAVLRAGRGMVLVVLRAERRTGVEMAAALMCGCALCCGHVGAGRRQLSVGVGSEKICVDGASRPKRAKQRRPGWARSQTQSLQWWVRRACSSS